LLWQRRSKRGSIPRLFNRGLACKVPILTKATKHVRAGDTLSVVQV
jgi:hypothetical protein